MFHFARTILLFVLVLSLTFFWSSGFANNDSICVDRWLRTNMPESLDPIDYTANPRLTLEQRINFRWDTGQEEVIWHDPNEEQSLQEQFCSKSIIILMWSSDSPHLTLLDQIAIPSFEKNTRFASCTFVNLVPNQAAADIIEQKFWADHYLVNRTKVVIDPNDFYSYLDNFEWREIQWNVFPYYMIVWQDGRIIQSWSSALDWRTAEEMLAELSGVCRSYDCDWVVTSNLLPQDAELDVDNDWLENDHPEEYDIDWDNQTNWSNTERHLRWDVDGDWAKNMFDMDIDCDGIPNDDDATPYGNTEPLPECWNWEIDIWLTETCDDGNDIDTDECTNECKIARCGDGIIWEWEEVCDDWNPNSNDGCSNTCESESCGDGIKQSGLEECDDWNTEWDDWCSADCTIEEEEEEEQEEEEQEPTEPQPWEWTPWGNPTSWSSESWNEGWEETGWEETGWEETGWEETGWEETGWEETGWEETGWEETGWEETGWEETGGEETGWEESGGLPWSQNPGTVAWNGRPTDWTEWSGKRLTCETEYQYCVFKACESKTECWTDVDSCACACLTKRDECYFCSIVDWWDEHACACKEFDHIYLNTDIPFIWQCILKRPARDGHPDDTVSAENLPNLDTAFPRFVSGLSRLIQSLILVLWFVAIVIAWFMISAWGLSADAKNKWVSILKWVIIALVLLWSSGIILRLINPNFFWPKSSSTLSLDIQMVTIDPISDKITEA